MELRADLVRNLINRYKIEACMISVSILTTAFSIVLILHTKSGTTPIETITCSDSMENSDSSNIQVDLSGAVLKPDVYSLAKGTRLKELIELGGGFQESADLEYVTYQYNFASELKDEDKIYIPFKGVRDSNLKNDSPLGRSQIHINSADKSELETLPSIGQITAEKIINNRPYKSTQELVNNKIISKGTYDKISELIDL